jgi:hypothetical protein
VAARRLGRHSIGGDVNREHADLAALWIQNPTRPGPKAEIERAAQKQITLF